jgi:hypothetical protein
MARLVTVPDVARDLGVSVCTARRRLRRLHASARYPFMVRQGSKWLVNLSQLLASAPALFEHRFATRGELGELVSRVVRVEKKVRAQRGAISRSNERLEALERRGR